MPEIGTARNFQADYTYFRNMRTCFICLAFLLILLQPASAQNSFLTPADSLNKTRFKPVSAGIAACWTGSTIALSQVWYSDYNKVGFHSFDDSHNWLQMDKLGHVFTAYHLSRASAKLYRWTGLSDRKSAWLGAGIGWGYQFSFELLDARSSGWGFSWSDLGANTIGSGLFLAQELAGGEQFATLKFSYSPTKYAAFRPSILGATPAERLLKDYNGQTYWLNFSPGAIWTNSRIPPWIAVSIGYSADAKLVGDQDFYASADGMHTFSAQREFLLSLDLNVSKLPIKKPWIRKLLSPFNVIKVPFPTLLWRGNTLYGKWFYF
jgi:uncharacterized protein YfiM (DUF2279 family)